MLVAGRRRRRTRFARVAWRRRRFTIRRLRDSSRVHRGAVAKHCGRRHRPTRPPRPRSSVRAFAPSVPPPEDGARSRAAALPPEAVLAYSRACRGFGDTGGFLQASLSARGYIAAVGGDSVAFAAVDSSASGASRPRRTGPRAVGDGSQPPCLRRRGRPRSSGPYPPSRRSGGSFPQLSSDCAPTLCDCCATNGFPRSCRTHRPTHVFRIWVSGRREFASLLARNRPSELACLPFACAFPPCRLSTLHVGPRDCRPGAATPQGGISARGAASVAVATCSRSGSSEGLARTHRARRAFRTARAPCRAIADGGPRPRDPTTRKRATVALRLDSVPLGPQPGISGYIGAYRTPIRDGEPYPKNGSKKGSELASGESRPAGARRPAAVGWSGLVLSSDVCRIVRNMVFMRPDGAEGAEMTLSRV